MNDYLPYLDALKQALEKTDGWRRSFGDDFGDKESSEQINIAEVAETMGLLARKLQGNYPFHHPQYAGQMLKPPHPVAWLAYSLAMTINPNNHALDGGPPTSKMEKEVVKKMAEMVGYDENHLGHLTSGGTIANLEALFIARELHPNKAIAATSGAHYTHKRMCRVLNCDFIEIPVDSHGEPDFDFIRSAAGKIGTFVVTMGTTGLGRVEPLSRILEYSDTYGFRTHVDAAYGGFFKLIAPHLPSKKEWGLLHKSDSIVIDPHKHGLQPYGCGSVLYKDASVGTFFKHDSPYTYFTSNELHLGEISLECSRAGAAAAAFWATLLLLPLSPEGLGSILSKTRSAALHFAELIRKNSDWQLYCTPELDIAAYFKKPGSGSLRDLNHLTQKIFGAGMKEKENGFHLSLFKIPAKQFVQKFPEYKPDAGHAVILRSVFMKEEHTGFIEELACRLFKTVV